MATNFVDDSTTRVRELIHRLQSPIPDLPTVLALLSSPLDCLGLLPSRFKRYNVEPLADGVVSVPRHIPPIQRAILEHVVPTWAASLAEQNATLLIEQYFCPDTPSSASPATGDLALLAYSTILSQHLTEYAIRLLVRLSVEYPIDRLHSIVFSGQHDTSSRRLVVTWEDCVCNVVAVPAKVANAVGGNGDVPPLLENGTYFNNVGLRCESLISSLSVKPSRHAVPSMTFLFTKLVNIGLFPPSPPTSRSQPSFFQATLPNIRAKLDKDDCIAYSAFWSDVILGLPSTFTLRAVLVSLLASLPEIVSASSASSYQRALVKREAWLLRRLVGPLKPENDELWECISAVILGRDRDEGYGRIFVCWAAESGDGQIDEQALQIILDRVLEVWSSPDHIKHSLLARHRYLTSLLLVAVSYLPPSSNQIQQLAVSPALISGVGTYIGHLDSSVRHCGMLVAEVIANLAGKKLDFGDWDGNDAGKSWAREIRELIKARDLDADLRNIATVVAEADEKSTPDVPQTSDPAGLPSQTGFTNVAAGYDSDDSLTGYASQSSSRSTSPTPSELNEIEKEPALAIGNKKVARPVYLAQLGELIRGPSGGNDSNQDADRIETALNYAEELIRRKRSYGTELDENAVNLVYGLVGLQDNYNLEGFEVKRQNAVNALVACCARKAAPSLIEEFFKSQYSTNQRYVILNALALGARELAAASPLTTPNDKLSFPSKTLPPRRHQQYLSASRQDTDSIPSILDAISNEAIERGRDNNADAVPALVRERRLRIRTPAKITEVNRTNAMTIPSLQTRSPTTFTDVSTEFFIGPLINRFWLFLRDEQMREERTAHLDGRQQYRGAGTGLILNPIVLAHFLGTLTILVHASQNAPEWLAVVAPDALELAVTLGTRPVSKMEEGADDGDATIAGDNKGKEAAVLTAALELALVVLDGCMELDGGRSLGLDHTALLLGSGEWAGEVFSRLEKGARLQGGGGAQEIKLKRAAAAVVLKVDDLTSRWRRSMVDIR